MATSELNAAAAIIEAQRHIERLSPAMTCRRCWQCGVCRGVRSICFEHRWPAQRFICCCETLG
jgi:hypothetical protein